MESKASVRLSLLQYYIHDSVDSCRLQLLGELSEAEVPELTGCWATAKTTLGARTLLVDLRKLKSFDEHGRQWIASMVNEGALLLPETFLHSEYTPRGGPVAGANASFLTRVIGFLRGSRALPAQSSTQAP